MSIFNKGEIYNIITDMETNFWVQRFAENRCVNRTPISVWNEGSFIVVSFRTKVSRRKITAELKNTFRDICDIRVSDYFTFVVKKEAR